MLLIIYYKIKMKKGGKRMKKLNKSIIMLSFTFACTLLLNVNVYADQNASGSVQQTQNQAQVQVQPQSVVSSNAVNLAPRMYIDAPDENSKVNGSVTVSGWALNGSGVKEVDVFLDGKAVGQATLGIARTDVDRKYPGYSGGSNSGFSYALDMSGAPDGTHTIGIQEVGKDNTALQEYVKVQVSRPQPRMYVDTNLDKVYGNITVSGWALNYSGIKEVKMSIDGGAGEDAVINLPRLDVDKKFPGYTGGKNSGFSYAFDADSLKDGAHTLLIDAVGNDGTENKVTETVNIVKPQSRMYLDTIYDGLKTAGNFTVSGWALNYAGVKQVNILIDGKTVGQATSGLQRLDVDEKYPGYAGGKNSGFSYTVDANSIQSGNHSITVQAIGNDGSVAVEKSCNVSISKLPARMYIDTASDSVLKVNNKISVSGWTLNQSGTKEVDVYVDGKLIGQAVLNAYRPDVNKTFPGYTNGDHSGFAADIDMGTDTSLLSGTHVLKVTSIANDGETMSSSFNFSKPYPRMYIDSPHDGQTISGSFTISGWALNLSGVKSIEVYVDGEKAADGTFGVSQRTDVIKAYPQFTGLENCEFNALFNTAQFANGTHKMTVYATGYDGMQCNSSVNFSTMNNAVTDKKYNISFDNFVNAECNDSPQIDSSTGWQNASRDDVSYYAEPDNFFNDDTQKYQFLKLGYMYGITADDLNDTLLNGKGTLNNTGACFLEAAQENNINPAYLASHALEETGNGTSALASGVVVKGQTVYNMFGLHAYDSDPTGTGSEWAYEQGWFTPEKAIEGGAKEISSWYINNSNGPQDTLYSMRWDPDDISHQYATDVRWAYNQVTNIKKLLDKFKGAVLIFEKPIFS